MELLAAIRALEVLKQPCKVLLHTDSQYVKKGSQICIEGRIQTRSWEQDGQKKYRTEIIADNVQFGSRPATAGAHLCPHQ